MCIWNRILDNKTASSCSSNSHLSKKMNETEPCDDKNTHTNKALEELNGKCCRNAKIDNISLFLSLI